MVSSVTRILKFRGRLLFVAAGILAILGCVSSAVAASEPPLNIFSTITADGTGRSLHESMIWTDPPLTGSGVAVAFRKTFDLPQIPKSASLSLFADARYILWVNGAYVDRGPSRFQPNGPQYDTVDLTTRLRVGRNCIVLLVIGNLSGGKVMRHQPGLTALLVGDGQEILRTDSSWKWSDNTRYRVVTASWANLSDSLVDARVENGDWTSIDYSDATWKPAAGISGTDWGPLTRTLIPPLRETPVPVKFSGDVHLPFKLKAGERLEFNSTRIVQAYPVIDLSAEGDSEISIEPYSVKYIARAGQQGFMTTDTQGISHGSIVVKSGSVTITDFKLVERLYPYQRIGSFKSDDEFLNRLWEMCARSCEVLSEDSYVDCADRERVEWMDDTPPGYDITRTAMAGPGRDGQPIYSDPRLLGNLIRRTALTLQPEGWVKAHTCSDRYDIHAKMEDRACDWIEGERLYYDATGDATILRETWPAITAQMNYFLDRLSPRGLVRGRDWVVWGNPTAYIVGEGATLNEFVQRALIDAAYLAHAIGEEPTANRYTIAASDLAKAINAVLWDGTIGAYRAGYFDEADIAESRASKHTLPFSLTDHLAPSTLHANVFALDRGIVPPERRASVAATMLTQLQDYTSAPPKRPNPAIMVYYYAIKQMYGLDEPRLDKQVLDLFRTKWAAMVDSPLQCSWESFSWGSKAHIYGMYPGYFLSAYVLGVRREDPVDKKRILIEPRLTSLHFARGTVVTEFGPVTVDWQLNDQRLAFSVEIPTGVEGHLRIPDADASTMKMNGQVVAARQEGRYASIDLPSQTCRGTIVVHEQAPK